MLHIPRMFHRIWIGNRPLPTDFEGFGQTWLQHHPGWTLHTWTDEHLHRALNRNAIERSVATSGKANIMRYEILLNCGGIYIDTDFECFHNIEPLLQGVQCFVGLQSANLANNAIIGAVPNHPFVQDLVYGLETRMAQFSRDKSITQSGPYYLSDVLALHSDVTVFPPEVFYPYQWHERWRRFEKFPTAYAAHHWSLSWKMHDRRNLHQQPPEISVLVINILPDAARLRWALAGLCANLPSTI